jgi:nitrogen fixation/metabolism regulation signal transduction histidine kinase
MALVNENPSLLYVVITRKDGFSIIHKKNSWTQNYLSGIWRPVDSAQIKKGSFIKSDIVNGEVYHTTFPFGYSGLKWGYIHIGLATDAFHKDILTFYKRTALIVVLAIIAGLVVSFLFARRISRPILMLNEITRQIGSGNLFARVEIKTGDEIEMLGNSVNKMAEALETSQAKLENTNKELVETARKAGMAEVATGVLHNVGNVLNSISISTASVIKRIRNSRADNIVYISEQFEEHSDDLITFLSEDNRAKKFQAFISRLSNHLLEENKIILQELYSLAEHIKHINEIVNFQQSFGKSVGITEPVMVDELIHKAVEVNAVSLKRHGIKVLYENENLSPMLLDRHKIIQILTNIINNAKDALSEADRKNRVIIISTKKVAGNYLQIKISDNGSGISKENMTRIFNHGFTTKKNGHGYGLHSGAISAKEMQGVLSIASDGVGKGAEITLKLPIRQAEKD